MSKLFKKKEAAKFDANSMGQYKEKFSFEAFFREIKTLDKENYDKWSEPVKVASWGLIFAVSVALSSFFLVDPVLGQIESAKAESKALLEDYKVKRLELVSAEMYQHQLKEVEKLFNTQLSQLPKESEIAGLVEDIYRIGVASNIRVLNIELNEELTKEVFIEQPISITAVGDFHSFGSLISMIATLPRIVTIEGFHISSVATKGSEIPQLTYVINASTYRYLVAVPTDATNAN